MRKPSRRIVGTILICAAVAVGSWLQFSGVAMVTVNHSKRAGPSGTVIMTIVDFHWPAFVLLSAAAVGLLCWFLPQRPRWAAGGNKE